MRQRFFAVLTSILAFGFCLTGGIILLAHMYESSGRLDPIPAGLGFYFVGKAVFVGALLLINGGIFENKSNISS